MNREQIIKALEWCSELRLCMDCPMREEGFFSYLGDGCRRALMENALSLIRELTEENELLGAEKEHLELVVDGKLKRTSALEKEVLKLTEENDRLRAATVRKMKDRIDKRCIEGGIYPVVVKNAIEQIAKEMLEGHGTPPDTCAYCGEVIPEGRQVCPNCIEKTNKKTKKARKESEKKS